MEPTRRRDRHSRRLAMVAVLLAVLVGCSTSKGSPGPASAGSSLGAEASATAAGSDATGGGGRLAEPVAGGGAVPEPGDRR